MIASKLKNVNKLVLEDPPWYSETKGEMKMSDTKDEFIKSQIERYETQRNFFISQKKIWRTSIDALRSISLYKSYFMETIQDAINFQSKLSDKDNQNIEK